MIILDAVFSGRVASRGKSLPKNINVTALLMAPVFCFRLARHYSTLTAVLFD